MQTMPITSPSTGPNERQQRNFSFMIASFAPPRFGAPGNGVHPPSPPAAQDRARPNAAPETPHLRLETPNCCHKTPDTDLRHQTHGGCCYRRQGERYRPPNGRTRQRRSVAGMVPVGMPASREETGPILPLLALARIVGTLA